MKTIHSLFAWLVTAALATAGGSATETAYQMQRAVLAAPDLQQIESLLQAGFPPQQSIGCGTFDALDGAVDVASPETAELFLRYGAKPKESTFVSAAFISSHDKATRIVRAFLAAGCPVNSKDSRATALHRAVYRQNVELVSLLLAQKGIALDEINIDDRTPLMIATEIGDKRLVEMLLKAGADPSARNRNGLTAAGFSQAKIREQQEIQALLQPH